MNISRHYIEEYIIKHGYLHSKDEIGFNDYVDVFYLGLTRELEKAHELFVTYHLTHDSYFDWHLFYLILKEGKHIKKEIDKMKLRNIWKS